MIDLVNVYLQNKFFIDLLYFIILLIPGLTIFFLSKKLYQVSKYEGIKYFRNAFLFYSLGIFFGLITTIFQNYSEVIFSLSIVLGEYSLTIAGFYLLLSLGWKKLQGSSQIPNRFYLLHTLALIIGILDFLVGGRFVMFSIQILLFAVAIFVSFKNYITSPKAAFLKYYFFAMVLFFITWILNFANEFMPQPTSILSICSLVITTIVFYIFFIGILLFTKK